MRKPGWGLIAGTILLVAAGCDPDVDPVEANPPTTSSLKAQADSNGHPTVSPTENDVTLELETELVALVNAYRVSVGLNALIDSGDLRDVARAHSEHMVMHGFFDHVSPEGLDPAARLEEAGLNWSWVGENIAAGYATPEGVLEAWLASPAHRAIIEDPTWTHTGAGYATDPEPTDARPEEYYWTQAFMRQ